MAEPLGAGPLFNREQMEAAIRAAEVLGADWKRDLGTVADAAAATGMDVATLMEYLGQIKAGEGERAMPMLRRSGLVSEQGLRQQGITFDKSGKIESGQDAKLHEAVLNAMQRFKGTAADIAKIGNAVDWAKTKLGETWNLAQQVDFTAVKHLHQGQRR